MANNNLNMKYTIFLFSLMISISVGCKQPAAPVVTYKWSELTITSENRTVITIDNADDSSSVKYHNFGSFFMGYHNDKIDSAKAYFTMSEKDSLFHLAKEIISNPVVRDSGCTDYVGELGVVIQYGWFPNPGSFKQSGSYTGVCEWDTLSNATRELHKILGRKIKWWHR